MIVNGLTCKQRCDREARRFIAEHRRVTVDMMAALLYSVVRPLEDALESKEAPDETAHTDHDAGGADAGDGQPRMGGAI